MKRLAVIAVLAALGGAPALAQEKKDPPPVADDSKKDGAKKDGPKKEAEKEPDVKALLERKVTLDRDTTPIGEALDFLNRSLDLNSEVDTSVDKHAKA